ncbi:MAG TPA: IclR family transcriptional regulator [Microbacterium sp.]|nr:IclR family transcriptional regulator [Microbacterium sp.]
MARASAGKSTLSRHLRLLEAFTADSPFLTLTDLARAADVPVSTVHGLLQELEATGLVERRDDRTYRLGLRLWELASRTPGALGLRETALPFLMQAHARIGQHVQLGVMSDRDVLFLERLSDRDAVVSVTIVGGRLPINASASGLVLLADLDDAAREAFLAGPLPRFTTGTPVDVDEVRRILRRVRRERFAVLDGALHPGVRGIAVPVRGATGETVAALGAVVPADDTGSAGVVGVLQKAADDVTAALRASATATRRAPVSLESKSSQDD